MRYWIVHFFSMERFEIWAQETSRYVYANTHTHIYIYYIYIYICNIYVIYIYIYILYIYIIWIIELFWQVFIYHKEAQCAWHTSCAQVLELLQSHFGHDSEGTLFSWLHMCYAHLASTRSNHFVCRGYT